MTLLLALGATILMESIIILPCFRSHCESFGKLTINFVLINCITNLSLNIIVHIFGIGHYILILELLIPIIEAYMFRYAGVTRSGKAIFATCFAANLLSFIVGIFIFESIAAALQPRPLPHWELL